MNMMNVKILVEMILDMLELEPDTGLPNLIHYLRGQGFTKEEIKLAWEEVTNE